MKKVKHFIIRLCMFFAIIVVGTLVMSSLSYKTDLSKLIGYRTYHIHAPSLPMIESPFIYYRGAIIGMSTSTTIVDTGAVMNIKVGYAFSKHLLEGTYGVVQDGRIFLQDSNSSKAAQPLPKDSIIQLSSGLNAFEPFSNGGSRARDAFDDFFNN